MSCLTSNTPVVTDADIQNQLQQIMVEMEQNHQTTLQQLQYVNQMVQETHQQMQSMRQQI